MFSSGNITEKLRVANFDCKAQTVVDLFAGEVKYLGEIIGRSLLCLVPCLSSEPFSILLMKSRREFISGVGYFTLPYLVHANAAHVIACEWNPDSVNALKRNLLLNDVTG